MKKSSLIAFVFIGAVIFYVTGGGALFGLSGSTSQRKSSRQPAVNLVGDQQQNPFAVAESSEE